mmetsp:Transcript_6662/g.10682  ORF Transcript_6662/g.10682 Transcript_6662/m.10682 type:complete len:549 (+) Transcript_6662:180-1826(+)
MCSTDEDIDYGSDFEEASDDDGHKSPFGETTRSTSRKLKSSSSKEQISSKEQKTSSSKEQIPPIAPAPLERAPSSEHNGVRQTGVAEFNSSGNVGKRAGRRSGYDDPSGKPPSFGTSETKFERSVSNGSTLGSGRLVRGKVSVGNEGDGTRPGTGESSSKAGPSRPMWLQHDDNAQSHVPRHNLSNSGRDFSADRARVASGSSDRHKKSDVDTGGRGRIPVDMENDVDARAGTADGDQRKIKRLQQEIQRLTQRLKDSDLYSAQDDGLPVFTLDEVEVGSQIAQGGFSTVHHARWKGTPCALKKIFNPVITLELRSEFENEVKMLRRLRHPNIITLMAVCRQPPALSILTECIGGGSLFELLHGPPHSKAAGSLDCELATTLPFMLQSSSTLAYLHAMLVVHRDIKSHNVLLTRERPSTAKLCDFGLSRSKADLQTGTMQYAGTPCYMAPELFAQRKYTEAVDVFAFGVMLWETLSTEIPHANIEPSDIAHKVQTKDYAGLNVAHSWPKVAKNLLRALLAVQPDDRPAMTAVTEQVRQILAEMPPADW